MEIWYTIGLLILGWLFGLLGPSIVNKIEQRKNTQEIERGIKSELKEIATKMATVYSLISMRYGNHTKEDEQWVVSILEKTAISSKDQEFISNIKKLLRLTDEDYFALIETRRAEENVGLNLKKYQAPYLEAKTGNLSQLPEASQRELLEIIASLHIFNEEIDRARYYFNLTFDSNLSQDNRSIVNGNIIQSYINVCERAQLIANASVEYAAK